MSMSSVSYISSRFCPGCFVHPCHISSLRRNHAGSFSGQKVSVTTYGAVNVSTKRTRVKFLQMTQGGDRESGGNEDNKGEKKADWDASWKSFQEERKSKGGVFELPPEGYEERQEDLAGRRVEKLTSAWSNENGFLIGIGVIGAIALFYGYVFVSGGISR